MKEVIREATLKELLAELEVTRATVWNYRKEGMPYKRKLNGQIRFNIEEVKTWVKEYYNR